MVNFCKVQKELLERLYTNGCFIYAQEMKENIIFTSDGKTAFIVPKNKFFLDLNRIRKEKFDEILVLEKKAVEAEKTIQCRDLGNKLIIKIANEQTEVWLDVRLLKLYGKNVTFKITDKKSPVFLYEKGKLVGFIMPIEVSE